MTIIRSVVIEAADAAAAERFYASAFDLGDAIRVRASDAPSSGFRGFTLSLIAAQPADVDAIAAAALTAGATEIKPAKKSLWGYGASLQAPDGTVWTVATSTKKDGAPASTRADELVLQLGAEDVREATRFYVDHGLTVSKSMGRYVEFDTAGSPVRLALNGRRATARNAGVPAEGSGSHRIAIVSDGLRFTDPDGFAWED